MLGMSLQYTGAEFSPCEKYRYKLWRYFRENPTSIVNFLMLNPSTATATVQDPTVERCCRRVQSWGFDGLIVTNLFAWRSTHPAVLKTLHDPIGPENNTAIERAANESALIVCAWGKDGSIQNRGKQIRAALERKFLEKTSYLRLCKGGEPEHPLYVPYSAFPKRFFDGELLVNVPSDEQASMFAGVEL